MCGGEEVNVMEVLAGKGGGNTLVEWKLHQTCPHILTPSTQSHVVKRNTFSSVHSVVEL